MWVKMENKKLTAHMGSDPLSHIIEKCKTNMEKRHFLLVFPFKDGIADPMKDDDLCIMHVCI